MPKTPSSMAALPECASAAASSLRNDPLVSPLKRFARVAEMQALADQQEVEVAARRLQPREETASLAKGCADALAHAKRPIEMLP